MPGVDELITEQDCLKIRLGSTLAEEIETSRNTCTNRGGAIGSAVGIVSGILLCFDREDVGFSIFYGTLMGLQVGLNVGGVLGLLYDKYRIKNVSQQHPDKIEYISRYIDISNALTGIRVRGTIE